MIDRTEDIAILRRAAREMREYVELLWLDQLATWLDACATVIDVAPDHAKVHALNVARAWLEDDR